MRTTWFWLLAVLVVMGLGAMPCQGQTGSPSPAPSASASTVPVVPKGPPLPDKPVTHILLLDVSGSLRTRGYAARNSPGSYKSHWTQPYLDIVNHLLQPGDPYFRPTDRFVVQTFSEETTEAKEKNPVIGPLPLSALLDTENQFPAPGGGATNMVHGLDLDRQVAENVAAGSGAVITWLITDNENNWQHSQDDRGFYQHLRDDPSYRFVHFIPIADPNRPGDSLVLYMMVHSIGETPRWVESLVEDTQQRLAATAILFRPLYNADSGLALDKEITYMDPSSSDADKPLDQEGNKLILDLREGQSLDGELRLKIRSTLKGWKLNNAQLSGQSVLTIPAGYKDLPDTVKVGWHFSPSALTVDPLGETSVYRLTPDGDPPKFERTTAEWLADPGAQTLKEIDGNFSMVAHIDLEHNQIQPLQDPTVKDRLHFVDDLDHISDYMAYQEQPGQAQGKTRTINIERPFIIRVTAGGLGRAALLLGGALALVLLGLVGMALFAWKSHYVLEGPNGSQPVVMPWFSASHVLLEPSGIILGRLLQRTGNLSFRPEEGVTVNGEARQVPIILQAGECRFETRRERDKPQPWTLSRPRQAAHHDAASSGPTL